VGIALQEAQMFIEPISARPLASPPKDPLRAKAAEFEAAFLSEMLAHAGLGEEENGFSGGIGESQFASFLRQEQAEAMVRAGGIGLAETLFKSLSGASNDKG
jgi:peptidoglycan hydrolase FlgJ